MADIAGAISKLNTDEVAQNKPTSEALFSKVGANINGLIEQKIDAEAEVSSSSGVSQSITSSTPTFTDITNASVTITTNGRPVWVGMISDGDGAGVPARIRGIGGTCQLRFQRDSTLISTNQFSDSDDDVATRFYHIDVVSAGTYTYKASCARAGGTSINIRQVKLVAIEI